MCIRWVDDKFEANKDFVSLHNVDDITTATFVLVVTDTAHHLNLSLSLCRGQCYDGASNMKQVVCDNQKLEPQAIYLHCKGHRLNLAVANTLKSIKCMCDALDVELEICKLLKYSARRDTTFAELTLHAPGIKKLLSNLLDCVCFIS